MKNDKERLKEAVFEKTNGRCHLSGRGLVFKNYGKFGLAGAWEIDHSVARERGGTDHLNNLFPACISANRRKRAGVTRTARSGYGLKRAPISSLRQEKVKENNTLAGLAVGATCGTVFGPLGIGIGAFVGALVGAESEVE